MKPRPRNILVMRFSALGDVAMTVPVIKQLTEQHPDISITFVSNPFHQPLFEGIPQVHFIGFDFKKEYKGFSGLIKATFQIRKIPCDAVADLHDVIRTKFIRLFLFRVPIAVINKGRKEKNALTKYPNKKLHPLISTFQRYANVFSELKIPIQLNQEKAPYPSDTFRKKIKKVFRTDSSDLHFIGLAPFARHKPKMYPLKKMRKVAEILGNNSSSRILLFGSQSELSSVSDLSDNKNILIISPEISFKEQLKLISQLDVMVSMDSANMHLASLYGIPVVSVWGGTHPFMGFYGWGQDIGNAVQTDLPCRPSSVYGNKICPLHGENGCMIYITPEMIVEKINQVLSNKQKIPD